MKVIKKRFAVSSYQTFINGRKKTRILKVDRRKIKSKDESVQHHHADHGISHTDFSMDSHVREGSENEQSTSTLHGPGSYAKSKSKRLADWKVLFHDQMSVSLEMNTPGNVCYNCREELYEIFRCLDCCEWCYLCENCVDSFHSHPHLHFFECWKVQAFIGYAKPTPIWSLLHHEECSSTYCKDVIVVDDKGLYIILYITPVYYIPTKYARLMMPLEAEPD